MTFWALEAEDSVKVFRVELQDGSNYEPDGEIVSQEEELL